MSGERSRDEEVDGRAFSNHHGHAAGLLLIGQATGMPKKCLLHLKYKIDFIHLKYLVIFYSKYTSTSVDVYFLFEQCCVPGGNTRSRLD